MRRSLAEALDLPRTGLAVFKDYVTRLEYIRDCAELWAQGACRSNWARTSTRSSWIGASCMARSGSAVCAALDGAGVDSVQGMLEGMSVGAALGERSEAPNTKRMKSKHRGPQRSQRSEATEKSDTGEEGATKSAERLRQGKPPRLRKRPHAAENGRSSVPVEGCQLTRQATAWPGQVLPRRRQRRPGLVLANRARSRPLRRLDSAGPTGH